MMIRLDYNSYKTPRKFRTREPRVGIIRVMNVTPISRVWKKIVNEEIISQVIEIHRGQMCDKDDVVLNNRANNSFFRDYEKHEETRNGVKRESLLYEWG